MRTSSRSRKMKIEFAVVNSMTRLRLPMSTIHHTCESRYATAQSKDNDLTEHYEFNWCLRSRRGCRFLMQSGTQYHDDVLKTRCEEHASCNSPCIALHHSLPPPQILAVCCDCDKNLPPRQLCYISPRTVRPHEPGSCYNLRQAPASSPTVLDFVEDFAS